MRKPNDSRAMKMFLLADEVRRGDKTKMCTGCYLPLPLIKFSTRKTLTGRSLIYWCKTCVKIKPGLPKPKNWAGEEIVIVNRKDKVHYRRARRTSSAKE